MHLLKAIIKKFLLSKETLKEKPLNALNASYFIEHKKNQSFINFIQIIFYITVLIYICLGLLTCNLYTVNIAEQCSEIPMKMVGPINC